MKLALGSAQFGLPYGIANRGGQVSGEEARKILQTARDAGIDTIDTAIVYGSSESCLGEIGVQGFRVVTKLPAVTTEDGSVYKWARSQIAESLRRLKQPSVHAILLHRPQDLSGDLGDELAQTLSKLKEDGLTSKIGVSVYSPTELEQVISVIPLDLVQCPYNLLDRRLLASGWMDKLREMGVEVHTRSSFLQGLLLLPKNMIPEQFAPWNRIWDLWHSWLADRRLSAAEACLSFATQCCAVDRVIVGVDSNSQLCELLKASSIPSNMVFPDINCNDEALINPSKWNR